MTTVVGIDPCAKYINANNLGNDSCIVLRTLSQARTVLVLKSSYGKDLYSCQF